MTKTFLLLFWSFVLSSLSLLLGLDLHLTYFLLRTNSPDESVVDLFLFEGEEHEDEILFDPNASPFSSL